MCVRGNFPPPLLPRWCGQMLAPPHSLHCGGASICPHQRQRSKCKECGGGEHLPAPAPKEQMQGVRGGRASARTSAGGANKGSPPRTPCMGSSADGERRCSYPRTPCIGSFDAGAADARPPALLACAPDALVRAEARPPSLLAFAPPAFVPTDTALLLAHGASRSVGLFAPQSPARATAGRRPLVSHCHSPALSCVHCPADQAPGACAPSQAVCSVAGSRRRGPLCFFVLCNRHLFNRVPDPPPRDRLGVTYLPSTISSDAGYADLP